MMGMSHTVKHKHMHVHVLTNRAVGTVLSDWEIILYDVNL